MDRTLLRADAGLIQPCATCTNSAILVREGLRTHICMVGIRRQTDPRDPKKPFEGFSCIETMIFMAELRVTYQGNKQVVLMCVQLLSDPQSEHTPQHIL